MAHSLSWYRKGDRYPGSKLYARTWTPDDPNGPVPQPLYASNNVAKSGGNHNNSNSSNSSQLQNQSSNQSSEEFNVNGGDMGDGGASNIFGSGGATGL